MKKALLFLCLTVGLSVFLFAFRPMKTMSFDTVPVVSPDEWEDLASARRELPFDLLSVTVCGAELPKDKETSVRYVPKITQEILFSFPESWHIVRTEAVKTAAGDTSCHILLYSRTASFAYTLTETGLPIIDVQLQQFDLDAQYLTKNRSRAEATIFSIDKNGHIQRETNRIEIKTRGGSSLNYPKKSYTLFFLDTNGRSDLHTPLGLPADRKFALNSLYEDESKIREALAHRLWQAIEPQNVLQFVYAELILNDTYYGLYGFHQIITENALQTEAGDTVFKINSGLQTDPEAYRAEQLPAYEIAVTGNADDHALLQSFFQTLVPPIQKFPHSIDLQNLTNYTILMELLAARDASLKNMVLTYRNAADQFRLTPWDMDQSFGLTWDISVRLDTKLDPALAQMRYTDPMYDGHVEPISILYAACPDFREAVADRYRELRETVFTDEAMLEQAEALYDQLTDCGARARDAERWPKSAISEDNSFMETFIPARMAYLDSLYLTEAVPDC